jgi:fluoride ion exporter CrcB/FEX
VDFAAWIIIIGGMIASVYLYAKHSETKNTFGTLFSHGFKTAAVTTCFVFIYVLSMLYVIDKERVANLVNKDIALARQEGLIKTTNEQIATYLPQAIKVKRMVMIAGSIMGNLFLGIIGSVLGSVISLRNKTTT